MDAQLYSVNKEHFRENSLFCGIQFSFIPHCEIDSSETIELSILFHGITKTVPSLFRGIFLEQNFYANPK